LYIGDCTCAFYFSDLFVDYVCETGTGVGVIIGTRIIVGARTGDQVRAKMLL
jgi:hypothetical protein